MSFSRVEVLFGKLEGTEGKFARDPTGFLGIEGGVFRKHSLEVSCQHVQGTEERHHRLERGSAQISLVVGRAVLKHFLDSGTTRLLGCSMNRCPYFLVVQWGIQEIGDLKGKALACREGPAQLWPLAQVFHERAGLRLEEDVALRLSATDKEALDKLVDGEVQAALLTRPHGLIAEEKAFNRLRGWPDVVDEPLPVVLETTEKLLAKRGKDLRAFIEAYREAIGYLKARRAETIHMLQAYLIYLDARLRVDPKQLERLMAEIAPDRPGGPSSWPPNGLFLVLWQVKEALSWKS